RGHVMHRNVTLTGFVGSFGSNTSGWTHRLHRLDRATSTGSVVYSLVMPAGVDYSRTAALDVNVDANIVDVIGLSSISGDSAIEWQSWVIFYRARA
ncbi:MAG: hypothetical protein AAFP86_22245, partial [Planctomycetota bacterium]